MSAGFNATPDSAAAVNEASRTAEADLHPAAVAAELEPIEVTIKLVIDRWEEGNVPRVLDNPRIQATRLSLNQAIAQKALLCSLRGQHAQLADGKHVDRTPDVHRWLMDQIAEQIIDKLELAERAAA